MRLLICAGGTGGGVYPALAVYHALIAEHPDVETLWAGSESGMDSELVKGASVPFKSIPAAGLHGVGLRALPGNMLQLTRGVLASRQILRDFRPDVLFFTGGFIAGPLAFAVRTGAERRDVPILLFVPDIEPGLALRSLARFADRITASTEDSQKYFKAKVIGTGYPLRSDFVRWTREAGRAELRLDPKALVLLIVGGSKGARSINQAIVPNLPRLLEMAEIVHVTGQLDWPVVEKARAGLTSAQMDRYHAFPYLHEEIGAAFASADLAVTRAGASTLGELPYYGLPAILVPYPHAWRYQKVNADYLAQRGAAVIVEDGLLEKQLLSVVEDLIENPTKRQAMQAAMSSLARPDAARAIASQIMELGGQGR